MIYGKDLIVRELRKLHDAFLWTCFLDSLKEQLAVETQETLLESYRVAVRYSEDRGVDDWVQMIVDELKERFGYDVDRPEE